MIKYNENDLKNNYLAACKDEKFRRLVKRVGLKDEEAMKYT